MIREELARLWRWEERHRRLLARITIALVLTLILDVVVSVAVLFLERHAKGSDVHTYGSALYFSTVQLLTVSSSLNAPVSAGGRALNVLLELWAVGVVTALAGSFASFFQTGDAS